MTLNRLAALAIFTIFTGGIAEAKILCDGGYQVTKRGERIVTPYCEDAQVAAVGREYGMRVTAEAVRTNPFVKQRVCQFAGADNRIRDACAGSRSDRFNRF